MSRLYKKEDKKWNISKAILIKNRSTFTYFLVFCNPDIFFSLCSRRLPFLSFSHPLSFYVSLFSLTFLSPYYSRLALSPLSLSLLPPSLPFPPPPFPLSLSSILPPSLFLCLSFCLSLFPSRCRLETNNTLRCWNLEHIHLEYHSYQVREPWQRRTWGEIAGGGDDREWERKRQGGRGEGGERGREG